MLLALARLVRRELRGVEAAVACASSCSTTCARRRRELADHLARDVPELGHALARLLPLDAERPGQLGAEVRLVEVAGSEPVALEDRLAVERAPLAVAGALRHVRDDHVRVQVRVLGAARAVLVGGGDETGARARGARPARRAG